MSMVAVSYSMMRQRGVHWIGNLRVHDTAAVAGGEGVALAAARVARPHGRGGAQACNVQKAPAAPLFGTGAWAPAVLHIRAFHREFRSHPSFIKPYCQPSASQLRPARSNRYTTVSCRTHGGVETELVRTHHSLGAGAPSASEMHINAADNSVSLGSHQSVDHGALTARPSSHGGGRGALSTARQSISRTLH